MCYCCACFGGCSLFIGGLLLVVALCACICRWVYLCVVIWLLFFGVKLSLLGPFYRGIYRLSSYIAACPCWGFLFGRVNVGLC